MLRKKEGKKKKLKGEKERGKGQRWLRPHAVSPSTP
jgi:hypothetical protein